MVKAPEDGSGPKKIKLFVNQPTIGFAEASDAAGVQDLDLTKDTILKGTPITLRQNLTLSHFNSHLFRFVKFQNVNCLSMFIESNQDDDETTVVSLIKVFGFTREVMNVANIKNTAQEED